MSFAAWASKRPDWQCLTCTREGSGTPPARCPDCLSEFYPNHGPHQIPVIMVAEGSDPRYAWRQYFVITDGRCAIVEMIPALLGGWRLHRVIVQGSEAWDGMERDAIVGFKMHSGYPPSMAPDLGEFRAKLLEVAHAGKLPG